MIGLYVRDGLLQLNPGPQFHAETHLLGGGVLALKQLVKCWQLWRDRGSLCPLAVSLLLFLRQFHELKRFGKDNSEMPHPIFILPF